MLSAWSDLCDRANLAGFSGCLYVASAQLIRIIRPSDNPFLRSMAMMLDLIIKGGPVMIPLMGFSVFTISTGLERAWFWYRLLSKEHRIVHDVLEAARTNLNEARAIAEQARDLPIGRFLLAPLSLRQPSPETFRLAMEAAGDKEFVKMQKGDKFLETTIGVAPLLGLLGTVTGLIVTFGSLNIGGGGTTDQATKAAAGIGEALITTAAGMIIAIIALLIFRALVSLQSQQMDYFSEVGNELELIYRQIWYEPSLLAEDRYYTDRETERETVNPRF